MILTGGAGAEPRPAGAGPRPDGIHFAMEFLPQQNKVNAGDKVKGQIRADGKHVIVIGGGDTGSDCVAPEPAWRQRDVVRVDADAAEQKEPSC